MRRRLIKHSIVAQLCCEGLNFFRGKFTWQRQGDNDLQAFVINLPDSIDRRARVVSSLRAADVPHCLVQAVDGRARHATDFEFYDDRACRMRHGRGLSGAEVACYLSHLTALHAFVASNASEALVLEDDVGVPSDATARVAEVSRRLGTLEFEWDVVNLARTRLDYAMTLSEDDGMTLRHSFYFPMISCALLWSRTGAVRFLESRFGRSVRGPYDTELRSHLARTGGGLSVDPPIFKHDGHVSDIDSGTVQRSDRSLGVTSRRPVIPRLVRHFPDYIYAHLRWTTTKLRSR